VFRFSERRFCKFFADPTTGKRIPIPDEFLKLLDIAGAEAA